MKETFSLINKISGNAIYVPTDVTDRDQVANLFNKAIEVYGQVDLLFNCAGVLSGVGASWEVEIDAWWRNLEVNLLGTYQCCHAILPHMIERDSGVIINMDGAVEVPLAPSPEVPGTAAQKQLFCASPTPWQKN
ncbi:MAG: SDR family NAD(P)-dependent oxidoreductase [Anaerolineaceae bacterium]|nr:SDR family NAD(P)-dependent oxidoreductase [Anaerolineaceae bacterium]